MDHDHGDHDHHHIPSNNSHDHNTHLDHVMMDSHANHDVSNSTMSHHASHGSHEMMMAFHASSQATILFSFWTTSSTTSMMCSCFVVVVLGILYEGLKVLREHLVMKSSSCANVQARETVSAINCHDKNSSDTTGFCSKPAPVFKHSKKNGITNPGHFIQTALHGLQVFYGYCLMLIFMTYNVWLCASVVIGAVLGYFLFSWRRHACKNCVPNGQFIMSEQCH